MEKQKKYLLLLIALIVIIIIAIHILQSFLMGASFGLRPMTHDCIGLEISSETAVNIFPDGNFGFTFPFHFRYFIPQDISEQVFCLGQDVWHGE